ncbi:MAG: PorV/PorQ family protein [Candidatus Poribacteria bacterium]
MKKQIADRIKGFMESRDKSNCIFIKCLKAQFIIILMLIASPIYGAFENVDSGARSLGMGSAFVSVADDASSIFNNPAGMAQADQNELSMSYMELYGLVSYSSISCIQKIQKNVFGIGVISSNDRDDIYQEMEVLFAYGRQIAENANIGINIRYLSSYSYLDGAKLGNGKGIAIDLGYKYWIPDKGISFGLDFHGPIGFIFYNRKAILGFGAEKYSQRTDFYHNIGISIDLAKEFPVLDKFLLVGELSDGRFCSGAEYTYDNLISIRSGLRLGNSLNRTWTTGLGFRLSAVKIDFAYISSPVNADTSQISVSIDW